jgi:pimeloyl-ACP methyl ester carboxylesterase
VAHFARTGNRNVVIQITGYGPTGTEYMTSKQSQSANLSAARIHYLKAGSGKKTLVLIHGFGDTSHMWTPLFDDFGKDYTIVAPDMRGLGESSRPASGYDKKTIANDIHELVKSLGYRRSIWLGMISA